MMFHVCENKTLHVCENKTLHVCENKIFVFVNIILFSLIRRIILYNASRL